MNGLLGLLARGAGLAAGAGVAREVAARLGGDLRPVVKEAVRAGLVVSERVAEWTAEARAQLDQIVAEAREEQGRDGGR